MFKKLRKVLQEDDNMLNKQKEVLSKFVFFFFFFKGRHRNKCYTCYDSNVCMLRS